MTRDEFITKYHDYRTKSEIVAKAEARLVNDEGIKGDEAVVIDFGDLGYCLMLQSTVEYLLGAQFR